MTDAAGRGRRAAEAGGRQVDKYGSGREGRRRHPVQGEVGGGRGGVRRMGRGKEEAHVEAGGRESGGGARPATGSPRQQGGGRRHAEEPGRPPEVFAGEVLAGEREVARGPSGEVKVGQRAEENGRPSDVLVGKEEESRPPEVFISKGEVGWCAEEDRGPPEVFIGEMSLCCRKGSH